MAELAPTRSAAPWPLGDKTYLQRTLVAATTGTGATDYVNLAGYCSKAVVTVTNGSGGSVSVKVQGSYDGSSWADIGYTSAGGSGPARDVTPVIAATALAASNTLHMALVPGEWPRFVRANITANGSSSIVSIYLYAEK